MARVLAMIAACLLCIRTARADTVDTEVKQLSAKSQKVRMAAVLALAKSKDPRAVLAVAKAVSCPVLTSPDSAVLRMRGAL